MILYDVACEGLHNVQAKPEMNVSFHANIAVVLIQLNLDIAYMLVITNYWL